MGSEIIDMGNGYGRLTEYNSRYATLTFPLGLYRLRRLNLEGYISDAALRDILGRMGYEPREVEWIFALGRLKIVEWRGVARGLGII